MLPSMPSASKGGTTSPAASEAGAGAGACIAVAIAAQAHTVASATAAPLCQELRRQPSRPERSAGKAGRLHEYLGASLGVARERECEEAEVLAQAPVAGVVADTLLEEGDAGLRISRSRGAGLAEE